MIYKKLVCLVAVTAASFSLVSCGPNSKEGAVIGGLLGAGAGAIIGHQSGRGLEGAAIGGALGAGSGALIGDAKDDRQGYNNRGYDNRRGYDDRGYDNRSYDGRRGYDDHRDYDNRRYDNRGRGSRRDDGYYPY